MFSIIIPSWNNLQYLKLCIRSIVENSAYPHQIIVHVNDGSDGTIDFLQQEEILYTHSTSNIGICLAVNTATVLATGDYIVYMNDDMYVCPDWDKYILEEIKQLPDDNFMFSGTLIEPRNTNNPCVIHHDYGTDYKTFERQELLNSFHSHLKSDWTGSAWPPTVVSRRMWTLVGGYSVEFSPGMSSDDDFAIKMWFAGCRLFKGIAKSRIYHFQAKSTLRIEKNDGRRQFLYKWGMNQSTFNRYYIKRGTPFQGSLQDPDPRLLKKEFLRAKFKAVWHGLRG